MKIFVRFGFLKKRTPYIVRVYSKNEITSQVTHFCVLKCDDIASYFKNKK
jgi:hypothetical protein